MISVLDTIELALLRELHRHRRRHRIRLNLTVTGCVTVYLKEEDMSIGVTLNDTQQVTLTVNATDQFGNAVTTFPNPLVWDDAGGTVVGLAAAPDGRSATLTGIAGVVGSATVTVTAPGAGENGGDVQDRASITVVSGSQPVPGPTPAPAPSPTAPFVASLGLSASDATAQEQAAPAAAEQPTPTAAPATGTETFAASPEAETPEEEAAESSEEPPTA